MNTFRHDEIYGNTKRYGEFGITVDECLRDLSKTLY